MSVHPRSGAKARYLNLQILKLAINQQARIMPRIMKTTVVDDKVVIVEGPHESTTSQGTQAAQGKKKKPRFLPKKKKQSSTTQIHLPLKCKKGPEDCEEDAKEKERANTTPMQLDTNKKGSEVSEEETKEEERTDATLMQLDSTFFDNVNQNKYSIEDGSDYEKEAGVVSAAMGDGDKQQERKERAKGQKLAVWELQQRSSCLALSKGQKGK